MAESEKMSKSEQLKQKYLKRITERMGIIDDFEGLYEFLEASAEEALEKKAKQAKEQVKR